MSRFARAAFRGLLGLAIFTGARATVPSSLAAQEPVWSGGLFYDADLFSGSSPVWTDWWAIRALASRAFDGGSLGVDAATTHRFDLGDESVAADAYVDVWSGGYVHLRGRVAPGARLLPLSDWRLELFQALPGAWEASGSLWSMNVAGPDVVIGGLGVARYVRQWYLRGQASLAGIADQQAGAGAVFARRFFGEDGREYVEAGGGMGREVVTLAAGPVLDARRTWFLAASFQRFIHEPFGVHVNAGINDFEGIPRRRHLTVGLLARF